MLRYFFLVTALCCCTVLSLRAQPEPGAEPFEIRRVLLPPERLAAELERLRQGVFVKMPLSEFEERLRRFQEAPRASAAPRLLEAEYSARLVEPAGRTGEAFLKGDGKWTLLAPTGDPVLLPLAPLSVALSRVRFENREAFVGDFDRQQPCLLLDQPGKQSVLLDWTARGEQSPEGILFDWRVPGAPIAELKLNLPANRSLRVTPENCIVSTLESTEPGRKVWSVRFSGKMPLFLHISPPASDPSSEAPSPGGPLIVEQVRAVHQLVPEGSTSEFYFELRANGGNLRMLRFSCAPTLHPYEIGLQAGDAARLDRWEMLPPGAPGSPSTLVMHFRDALPRSLRPYVLCRSTLSGPADKKPEQNRNGYVPWSCPSLSLVPASLVPRAETVELRWDPRYRLDNFQPGDFHLSGVATLPGGIRQATWISTGLPSGMPTRPRAELRTRGADYQVTFLGWCNISPKQSSFEVNVQINMHHGALFELPLLLSPGWEVERVAVAPHAASLRNWSVHPGDGKLDQRLILQFQPPLDGRSTLTLRLRGPGASSGALLLPQITAPEASSMEGELGVDWKEETLTGQLLLARSAEFSPSDLFTNQAPSSTDGPWGRHLPKRMLIWRGSAPIGVFRPSTDPLRISQNATTRIRLAPDQAEMTSSLFVEVVSGSISFVDVRLSTPLPEGGSLVVRSATQGDKTPLATERLRGTGAAAAMRFMVGNSALGVAALCVPVTEGELWRVHLQQPLLARDTTTLLLQQKLQLPNLATAAGAWSAVPLPSFAHGPARGEVEVVADRRDFPNQALATVGLAEQDTKTEQGVRRFLYDGGPLALRVRQSVAEDSRHARRAALSGQIPRAELLTQVQNSGKRIHLYTVAVRQWAEPVFTLWLPDGARVTAARLEGEDVLPHAILAAGDDGSGTVFTVPAPRLAPGLETRVYTYEILYVIEAEPIFTWSKVQSSAPRPPMHPVVFRRIWRLPAGLTPVDSNRLVRLPGPVSFSDPLQSMLGLARGWAMLAPQALASASHDLELEQAFKNLSVRLGPRAVTLAELLRHLNDETAAEQNSALVVDALALEIAGIAPQNPINLAASGSDEKKPLRKVLDSHGLALLRFQSGWALTTPEQASLLLRNRFEPENRLVSLSGVEGLQEALERGHDRSGRYQLAAEWLTQTGNSSSLRTGRARPLLETLPSGDELDGWVDWEVSPGSTEGICLVRSRFTTLVGILIAALFLGVMWIWRQLQRRTRLPVDRVSHKGNLALLLGSLGLFGSGVLWLPAGLRPIALWPLIAALSVALGWYCRPKWRHAVRERPSAALPRALVTTAPALAVLLCCGWWATRDSVAQPAERAVNPDAIIYLLPTKENEEPAILVSPALLKKIESRLAQKTLAEVTILSAEYKGTVRPGGRSAVVEASLRLHSSVPSVSRLVLPFDGVDPDREPLLDGAPAVMTALSGPGSGYAISVAGVGVHTLVFNFTVEIARVGDLSELHWVAPRIVQSRLNLRLPLQTGHLQSLVHLGAQQIAIDGKQTILDVELGPAVTAEGGKRGSITPLHVRWSDAGVKKPPVVQYRDAYLWDLDLRGHSMTGVVLFDVGPGSTDELALEIPPELLVGRLEVRRVTGPKPEMDVGPVRLRDWRLSSVKGKQQLNIVFHEPVGGRVQVLLSCFPRATIFEALRPGTGNTAALRLTVPRPLGAAAAEQSYLAYRLQGLRPARAPEVLALEFLPLEQFPEFFWQAAGGKDSPLTYVGRIRRAGGTDPRLVLGLQAQAPRRSAKLHASWRVSAFYADLKATLEVEALDGELGMIECETAPALTVKGIRGADVRDWTSVLTSDGNRRIQIWLKRSMPRARLEIDGSVTVQPLAMSSQSFNLLGAMTSAVLDTSLTRCGTANLPSLRVPGLGPKPLTTTVELEGAHGNALREQMVRNLVPSAVRATTPGRLYFNANGDDYAGVFLVVPDNPPAWRVISGISVSDRQLMLRADLQPLGRGEEARSLRVRVMHGGGAMKLEAPGARVMPQSENGKDTSSWHVQWESPGERRLLLTATIPLPQALSLDDRTTMPVPRLVLEGAVVAESWLALEASSLRFQPFVQGRTPLASFTPALPQLEQVVKAGGKVWKLGGEDSYWLAVKRSAATVEIVHREDIAAFLDHRGWSCLTTWRLWHEGPAHLTVQLPPAARVFSLSVDGEEHSPVQKTEDSIEVTLSGAGARHLSVRWQGQVATSDPTRFASVFPQLAGEQITRSLRIVQAPLGYQPQGNDAYHGGAGRSVEVELERAHAELVLCERLLELHAARNQDPTASAASEMQVEKCRQRLACHLWRADSRSAAASDSQAEVHTLRDQARELFRRHGRTFNLHLPTQVLAVAAFDRDFRLAGAGYFSIGDFSPTQNPVRFELLTNTELARRRSIAATGLLLCCLFAVWLLAAIPLTAALTRFFWPEQVFVLGLIGYYLLGPTWVILFLLALGSAARLVWLVRMGLRLMHRFLLPRQSAVGPA